MRLLHAVALAAVVALIAAPAAGAHVLHTVAPGESLWSIAAQSNLTTRTVAVYNGLSPDAPVVLGSTLKIPSVAEGAAALAGTPAGAAPSAASSPFAGSTTAAAGASVATSSAVGAPRPRGAYVVRPGDTLSGLAAQTGYSVRWIAWQNGLNPAAVLLIGTVLKLPDGAPTPVRASAAVPVARVVPRASPVAVAGRLSAERIEALAAERGAPGSLAAAIAWQESGFNNAAVSAANARGIMQIVPGTWEWVQRTLGTGPLNPTSAEDNVRAGSAYLARLLSATGGDISQAVAGYYQGLSSVRARGMYDDTRRYVDNVLALRARFGG